MKEEQKIGNHIVNHLHNEYKSDVKDPVLQNWVKAESKNKDDLSTYIKIWKGINILANRNRYDADSAWKKIEPQILKPSVVSDRFKIRFLYGIAATLIILLGFSFYFNWFALDAEPLSLITGAGSRSELVLPDGTKVKLNSGSELIYHFDRFNKVRNVQFNGEGYFEVEKNKAPFIVQLEKGLSLKVLGTKFNLTAYPGNNNITTTLTEGKIELRNSEDERLVLTSGQVGSFNKKTGKLSYSAEKPMYNLGWIENKLYMDNMSLGEICKVLEKWYDVQITFADNKIAEDIHYTGVLQEKTIISVLKALNEISEIEYQINGKEINVSKKE